MHHLVDMEQTMSDKQTKNKWWGKVKKLPKDTMNKKRSNITASLKKIFSGTYQD